MLRREVAKNDFALPRRYVAMAAKFADTPVIPALSQQLEKAAASLVKPAKGGKGDTASTKSPADDDLRKEMAALREEVTAMRREMETPSTKPRGTATTAAPMTKSTKPRKG
jgi:hypothetical protein